MYVVVEECHYSAYFASAVCATVTAEVASTLLTAHVGFHTDIDQKTNC